MEKFLKSQFSDVSNILIATLFGIWVPLRISFIDVDYKYDLGVDVLAMLIVLILSWPQLKENKYIKLSKASWFFAIPIFSLTQLVFPVAKIKLLLALKLVILRKLAKVRNIFHEMDNLHPVVARIAPLALIVPVLIHILACGWIFIEETPEKYSQFFHYGRSIY